MFRLKKLVGPYQLYPRLWLGTNGHPKYTEKQLENTLRSKFVEATNIQVNDISGGCGAMYEIIVESREFQGISRVKQHQLISDTLKEEIKGMHGIRIHTIVAK